jgi:hypothetical protein
MKFNRGCGRSEEKQLFKLNQETVETDLWESIYDESAQHFGVECIYLPRTFVNIDEIIGEDLYSVFEEHKIFKLRLYLTTSDMYSGSNEIIDVVGIMNLDETSFQCAKQRIAYEAERQAGLLNFVPKEGDLIYCKDLNNDLFEVHAVEAEYSQFYDRGRAYAYEFKCLKYAHGGDQFKTGNRELDNIPNMEATNEYGDNKVIDRHVKDVNLPVIDPSEIDFFGDI